MWKKKDKSPEQDLCEQVRIAKELCFPVGQAKVIEGDLIRSLALSLPLPGRTEACALTPFGIRIVGATIKGDILLDRAVPPGGGALCPIEFERCDFIGRFSGVHARFSRLGFRDCTFQYPLGKAAPAADDTKAPEPTIDLTGASLDADLHLVKVRPQGVDARQVLPRARGNHMWIRLVGARIDGELDLCDCHLRAPPQHSHLISENAEDALDLTLAEISGDLQLVGCCRIEGRIKMRAAHIRGDVWMSSAEIENPGDEALFMQGARVEGLVMLDGRFERRGDTGRFRRFKCVGEVSLGGAEIGRGLYVNHAVVRGPVYARNLTVHANVELDGEFSGPVDLTDCRIEGSLDIAGLNLGASTECLDLGASTKCLNLGDGTIGRTFKLTSAKRHYELCEARSVRLRCFHGVDLVETLWQLKEGDRFDADKDVPADGKWAQVAFLIHRRRLGGLRVLHLDGHADVFERAAKHFRRRLRGTTVIEYAQLYGAYVHSAEGTIRLAGPATLPKYRQAANGDGAAWRFASAGMRDDVRRCWIVKVTASGCVTASPARASGSFERLANVPRFRNGLIVRAPLERDERDGKAAKQEWLAHPALHKMKSDPRYLRLERKLACHLDWNPLFQGEVNLEGLSCEMLDDNGGRAWGEHPDRVRINHFTYQRVAWDAETVRKTSLQLLWGGLLQRLLSAFARFWPGGAGDRTSEPGRPLEPWEARRNWLYRQFPTDAKIAPGSSRIRKSEFRPQPFEQIILVARDEGREDLALEFEVLRSRIEWRIFNRRIRWTLAPYAIIAAAIWLVLHEARSLLTLAALAVILVVMALLSFLDTTLRQRIPSPVGRWLIRNVAIWAPALFLLWAGNWWATPFHYIVAFVIFCSIRLAAVLSNALMRIGTGYLRKPINAFIMLIIAFLIGWAGVHEANLRHMVVVEAQATATLAGPDDEVPWPPHRPPPPPYDAERSAIVMGSAKDVDGKHSFREIPCSPGLSEPLFALDVLVPLVDLHEETRCGVRRLPVPRHRASQAVTPPDESLDPCQALPKPVRCMGWGELWDAFPSRALESHRFWWWMKALYAIAGWFLVSLALLTFAQVNRTRGEVAGG